MLGILTVDLLKCIQMLFWGVNSSILSVSFEDYKADLGVEEDTDLTAENLKQVVKNFKQTLLQESGVSFPTNPMDQLWLAIEAVFKSWSNSRAINIVN